MKKTMYKANYHFKEIGAVTVVNETARFVDYEISGPSVISGRSGIHIAREARNTDRSAFRDTWQEAHAWLLAKAKTDLGEARRQLDYAQGKYGNIKGMKE